MVVVVDVMIVVTSLLLGYYCEQHVTYCSCYCYGNKGLRHAYVITDLVYFDQLSLT